MPSNSWHTFVATYRASHPGATMRECSTAYRSSSPKKRKSGGSQAQGSAKLVKHGRVAQVDFLFSDVDGHPKMIRGPNSSCRLKIHMCMKDPGMYRMPIGLMTPWLNNPNATQWRLDWIRGSFDNWAVREDDFGKELKSLPSVSDINRCIDEVVAIARTKYDVVSAESRTSPIGTKIVTLSIRVSDSMLVDDDE